MLCQDHIALYRGGGAGREEEESESEREEEEETNSRIASATHRAIQQVCIYMYRMAGNLEGANFRINVRKAFRINVRILIFVCAHAGMPRPLVWQVHVYLT